jgi:dephospho-CoA kinase
MRRVGLTGGIATGKSYVLSQLRARGIPCLDADELAHGVTAAGTEATHAIAERFGPDILDAEGAVDRRKLGPIVFADPAARRDLEVIVHPAVRRAIAVGLRAFELVGDSPIAVVDIPLLFETHEQRDFARVIVTSCPEEVQLARLQARGLSVADAKLRLEAQMPTAEKVARADFVIDTGGSFDDTNAQIERVVSALRAEA